MLKKLRRWHFDLGLLLGLVIFGSAYYLSIPRPLWSYTTPAHNWPSTSELVQLGFAEDDSCIYTGNFFWWLPNQQTPSTIYQWETATGKLLQTYPFQIPHKDIQLAKSESEPVRFHCWTTDYPSLLYSMISFASNNNKNIFRLYETSTGACLGNTFISRKNNDSFSYLMQNPQDGHHLALVSTTKDNGESSVIDLATGTVLHTIKIPRQEFVKATTTPDGQFLVVILITGPRNWSVEVHRMHTWENLGRYPLTSGHFQQLALIDATHWVTRTTISLDGRGFDREQLDFFEFNPESKTLTPISNHPLQKKVVSNDDRGVIQGNYFFTNSTSKPLSHYLPILAKLETWLDSKGIKIKHQRKTHVQVWDIRSGELIKQLDHLPEGYYQLSRQARYLSYALQHKNESNQTQVTLDVYALPHHLWNPFLSWSQYLAWFLILPWPLRYSIARRNCPKAKQG